MILSLLISLFLTIIIELTVSFIIGIKDYFSTLEI